MLPTADYLLPTAYQVEILMKFASSHGPLSISFIDDTDINLQQLTIHSPPHLSPAAALEKNLLHNAPVQSSSANRIP